MAARVLVYGAMELNLRKSEVVADPGIAVMVEAVKSGVVYAFVPAHGDSKVGAVHLNLGRTWAEDLGLSVLLADFDNSPASFWQPMSDLRGLQSFAGGSLVRRQGSLEQLRPQSANLWDTVQWIERARRRYDVVAADLTHASKELAREVMLASTSIFLVSDSYPASLHLAREKAEWLHSEGLGDQCALLLEPVHGGLSPDVAEDVTGIPVCSLIGNTQQMKRLAAWLTIDCELETIAN